MLVRYMYLLRVPSQYSSAQLTAVVFEVLYETTIPYYWMMLNISYALHDLHDMVYVCQIPSILREDYYMLKYFFSALHFIFKNTKFI